jgi:hypothetical protein
MTEYTRDENTESVVLPAWVVAEIDRLRTERDQARLACGEEVGVSAGYKAERDDARLDNMMLRGLLEHHGITIA